MSEYQPISFKYLTGWGGELPDPALSALAAGASIEDIKKLLRRQSRRDRETIRNKWRNLYSFYASELVDEPTHQQAMTDGYLRSVSQELDVL
jgi:hypothetical protein